MNTLTRSLIHSHRERGEKIHQVITTNKVRFTYLIRKYRERAELKLDLDRELSYSCIIIFSFYFVRTHRVCVHRFLMEIENERRKKRNPVVAFFFFFLFNEKFIHFFPLYQIFNTLPSIPLFFPYSLVLSLARAIEYTERTCDFCPMCDYRHTFLFASSLIFSKIKK